MAGGLLQLVANSGMEDLYLTTEPQITLFKKIYRRHTNFTIIEKDLTFNTDMNFGKLGNCVIHKWGDLLHKLFLSFKLPKVNILYKQLTVKEVQTLLLTFNINWITNLDPNSPFDQNAYNELVVFLTQYNEDIVALRNTYNQMLIKLSPGNIFDPNVWFKDNSNLSDISINNKPSQAAEQYYEDVVDNFVLYDKYFLEYLFVDAQKKDKELGVPISLTNALDIENILYNDYVDYATSFSNTSYSDENIRFMLNVDTANYVVNTKVNQLDSNTVFRTSIANIYNNVNYLIYDSYKIFDNILLNNQIAINSNADVQNVKTILLDNIRYGLIKNIKLLSAIYDTLDINTKFIFYRKYAFINPGLYSTSSSFNLNSLQSTNSVYLIDNFTNKLDIPPEPNQPSDVNQPFSNQVDTIVNNFHLLNRELYRANVYSQYFNDYSLWSSLDLITSGFAVNNIILPINLYFMNYCWLIMVNNIPKALNNWLNVNTTLSSSTITNLINIMTLAGNNMFVEIQNLLNTTDTFNTLINLATVVKSNVNDIIITSMFRPNYIINNSLVPDYIINTFIFIATNYNAGVENNLYLQYINDIIIIIKLFVTPVNNIPTYTQYFVQNQNISNNTKYYINNISATNTVYNDILTSIYYNIFLSNVANYNNLYNNSLLGFDYYFNNVGIELLTCIEQIAKTYFLNSNLDVNYNYYLNANTYQPELPNHLTPGNGSIGIVLNDKLNELNTVLAKYDANRLLLNMPNIIVPKSQYFYDKANNVINFISNTIENNFATYSHQYHPIITEDIVLTTQQKYLNNLNNAIDISFYLYNIHNEFIKGISTGPNKDTLYKQYKDNINPNYYNILYDWLIGPNGAIDLYNYNNLIETKYNAFMTELDYYDFIKYYTLLQTIISEFVNLQRNTVELTNQAMITYLQTKINELNIIIKNINNNTNNQSLLEILAETLKSNTQAKFAWIKKIGHYIINYITIQINDQVIDGHTGQWLDLNHELTMQIKKEKGYRKLIGDVPELTILDNKVKEEYEIIVPLQFWFCKHIGVSLPLVALLHSDIVINLKLKEFEQVCNYDLLTYFPRKIKLSNFKIISQYIYVESEERERFAKNKLEYLIDQVQYNNEIFINRNNINEDDILNAKVYFKNICKELVWCCQSVDNILAKNYEIYTVNNTNPMKQCKINFNSRGREDYKDSAYYNFIVPYERHQHSPSTGINNYCFALYPEKYQPSGVANFNRIDDASIEIKFSDEMLSQLTYREGFILYIYCVSSNILRISSGLAGLLFF